MATRALPRLTLALWKAFEADRLGGLSDDDLLTRFREANDAAAFEALVRRNGPLVLAACRKVLGDSSDADDAFQATIIVLLRRAKNIRRGRSVGSWLYGVAHRVAVRLRADAHRRRRREAVAASAAGAAGAADLSWREACAVLHEELDRLPERYRLPLLLCYLEGKSRDEAAGQLGLSTGAVKGRLERGRERLRRRLERRGLALEVGLLATGLDAPAAAGGVPPALVSSTLNAALLPAERAAGSARAVLLARGVSRAMTTARRTTVTAALLLAGVAAVGLAVGAARPGPGATPPTEKPVAADAGPAKAGGGRSVAVSGRVLGPDGKPLAGAKVYLPLLPAKVMKEAEHAGEEELLGGLVCPKRATTGGDGAFRFSVAVAEGDLALGVVATADGFGPDLSEFPKAPPPATAAGLTLRLVRDDVPVRGRVLDMEGRPVPGVGVTLVSVEVPPGGDLTAYLNEYRQDPRKTYGKNRYLFAGPPLTAPVKVGADGRFEIRGVGRDRVAELLVSGPGVERTSLRVLTRAGVDVKAMPRTEDGGLGPVYGPTFTHVLSPERSVSGTVRERGTGRPVAGARVWGNGPDFHNQTHAVTDAAGRYRLTGLAKGKARRLYLYPPDGSPLLGAGRELPDDAGLAAQRADFELVRGVVVTGRLTDQATGKPVRGSLSYLPLPDNAFLKELPDPRQRSDRTCQPTGADGTFRMVVMPGSGILMAQADDNRFRPAPRPAGAAAKSINPRPDGMFVNGFGDYSSLDLLHAYRVLNPGKDDAALTCDLTVDPGKTMAGVVLGPDGKPLAGARVRGLSARWGPPRTLSGADFSLLALAPPEPRVVVAWHDGRRLAGTATVRGDEGAPVRLTLRPAGVATGRMVDAAGRPLAEARVHYSYRDAGGEAMELFNAGQDLPVAVTDKDGRFRVEGLVPGLGATVHLDAAGKGGKMFFPGRGKAPVWAVKAGATEELGDVPVQLSRQ